MGVLSSLLSGNILDGAANLADALVTTDKERIAGANERKRLEIEDRRQQNELMSKQIAVNTAEARHRSMFVAGWRPAIGWTCALAMCYHFLIEPLFGEFLAAAGWPLGELAWQELSPVLLGMLGMAGLRTYEKSKGITK